MKNVRNMMANLGFLGLRLSTVLFHVFMCWPETFMHVQDVLRREEGVWTPESLVTLGQS